MQPETIQTIAKRLDDAGYAGLFLTGDSRLADSLWGDGKNRASLEQIARGRGYGDLTRLLASELLYERVQGFPQESWSDVLAHVYTRALAITGVEAGGMQLPANLWGFMHHWDGRGVKDYGPLGARLVGVGPIAVAHLASLLDDADAIFYEGSQEATIGNRFGYRVNDAAAYYIGQITGIPVAFHEQIADRDAEIERLKESMKRMSEHE
jgi:hypothetical protein